MKAMHMRIIVARKENTSLLTYLRPGVAAEDEMLHTVAAETTTEADAVVVVSTVIGTVITVRVVRQATATMPMTITLPNLSRPVTTVTVTIVVDAVDTAAVADMVEEIVTEVADVVATTITMVIITNSMRM